ncbi:renalase [Impatiens glandulifera]|uniref:renalase n=1 Tax=Impatiens glandulifera TaxID=253017 RepID=UPI001FB182BB|nr:renalase [Impatiens glandulifera]
MNSAAAASKIAVIGCGISGAVCASSLARNGVSVAVFETARGPGGRMSERKETTEDGKEMLFDHGAPYFHVSNPDVLGLVRDWEARGIVSQWKDNFGSFDCLSKQFTDIEKEGLSIKYVGVPGMNSICKALCNESGVESKFRTCVGKVEWLEEEDLWSLTSVDGQSLGHFKGVVASDKNIISDRFTTVTGRLPPIDLTLVPELATKINEIPVNPCFALMLTFGEPLRSIPFKAFSFEHSETLSWAFCNSSKPGRPKTSECCWVVHSTAQYAKEVIAKVGLGMLSNTVFSQIAEELFQEFQKTAADIPHPLFMKAHRWGSAFPAVSVEREEKCLWDGKKRLAFCGDFCVSPNVEGAIISGLAAASKFVDIASCL